MAKDRSPFAKLSGDVVPKRIDGVVKKQYSHEDYTLLPHYFTWNQLHAEMLIYVLENKLEVREPRPSTFRKLLQRCCPNIRIRSPRSNVCDVCTIMYTKMKFGVTADLTEELGHHTTAAKEMRSEYKNDLCLASEECAVIVMDFSQKFDTSERDIHSITMSIEYNYVYDESAAGKGTDEVKGMVHHFIQKIVLPGGHRRLPIYADNCGGQNKKNFVVKVLLALAQMGGLEPVAYQERSGLRFWSHQKEVCQRGHMAMDQLLEVVNAASVSSALVHIAKDNNVMKVFRKIVKEAYKDLGHMQHYQIFEMEYAKPGVVSCRVGPTGEVFTQDLRRSFGGIQTNDAKLRAQAPPPNLEKKQQMYNKVRPYVPHKYVDDTIYDDPNDEEVARVAEAKQVRRKAAAMSKKTASTAPEAKDGATEVSRVESNAIEMNSNRGESSSA
ncbi:Hypothetical protein PHPALM_9341 [Phytophthora palmivora]|uniref:Uncharacterized protein n=1 Tax=Phytophthora palmivora TaxID=4796 RepID=A0A2P4Y7J1_9STRA|nr:Hypothetical protein PHPALM_9341 [Phytophthora palmivora]